MDEICNEQMMRADLFTNHYSKLSAGDPEAMICLKESAMASGVTSSPIVVLPWLLCGVLLF